MVVVSVPFGRYGELPAEGFAGKVVIDTNNYYPQRDGYFEELDRDRTTSSAAPAGPFAGRLCGQGVQRHPVAEPSRRGRPAGDPERFGIPISGDDEEAKRIVAELIDEVGFDAIDAGTLAAGGRKHQPGSPAYTMGVRLKSCAPPCRLTG